MEDFQCRWCLPEHKQPEDAAVLGTGQLLGQPVPDPQQGSSCCPAHGQTGLKPRLCGQTVMMLSPLTKNECAVIPRDAPGQRQGGCASVAHFPATFLWTVRTSSGDRQGSDAQLRTHPGLPCPCPLGCLLPRSPQPEKSAALVVIVALGTVIFQYRFQLLTRSIFKPGTLILGSTPAQQTQRWLRKQCVPAVQFRSSISTW